VLIRKGTQFRYEFEESTATVGEPLAICGAVQTPVQ
jgi:hypothetical protein